KLHLLVSAFLWAAMPGFADPSAPRHYATPEKTDDGWETASAENAGLDPALLQQLLDRVTDDSYKNIHSILVAKGGRLAFEEYFSGKDSEGKPRDFQRSTLHTQQSATKSVTSILIGIALDQHLIPGVDEKLSTLLPDHAALFSEGGKDVFTLRHCLS